MPGGIGRYAANLTKELQKSGLEVYIVCDMRGNGDFYGISPTNTYTSEVLLQVVDELKPDIVHVQFDPGLYGLRFDPKHPKKACSYINKFYYECNTPVVTTFHSGYTTLRQWINPSALVKSYGRIGNIGTPIRAIMRFWKYYLNYQAFNTNIIKDKIRRSRTCIVFSEYMSKNLSRSRISRSEVIYHGSEPAIYPQPSKKEARSKFSIPVNDDQLLALAFGFSTSAKGWDILNKIDIPNGWKLVVNSSSKSYYNKEEEEENIAPNLKKTTDNNQILDLHRGYLTEQELSTLFYACDVILLPYKSATGSGIMFDALAHGLPFIATDLEFFKEFTIQGLGITVKRHPHEFSRGLRILSSNYIKYKQAVNMFKAKLKWDSIAKQHYRIYNNVIHHNTRRTSSNSN
jgi:glycosyltransferase involved in cell wall biosynthesis